VEGPIGFNFEAFEFEYGGVEGYALPTPRRIASWIDANIHVQGRPEWVFVKVFSHGQQFRESILDARLDPMLSDLERICAERGMRLHYMTARRADENLAPRRADGPGAPFPPGFNRSKRAGITRTRAAWARA